MEAVRFEKFTLLIDGIHKSINKLKVAIAPDLGIKGVHVFWLYILAAHSDGLSSAELAAVSDVDRSLVSREIAYLSSRGYIVSDSTEGKRGYNSRHVLTEKGKALADKILDKVLEVQELADAGITPEEIAAFYVTLEKLRVNFGKITEILGEGRGDAARDV